MRMRKRVSVSQDKLLHEPSQVHGTLKQHNVCLAALLLIVLSSWKAVATHVLFAWQCEQATKQVRHAEHRPFAA